MAFMRPFISEEKELILILDDGTTTTLDDEGIDLPVGEIFSDGDVSESWEPLFEVGADRKCEEIERVFRLWPHVSSFEVVYKYFGYLSAPGYMDCTDFVLGNTRADVAEQLLDMHYDFEEDHMDVDELGDMHWLEEVAGQGGGMKPHEIRELVNELTAIAQKYGKMQQIRDRIAHCLLDALEKAAVIKENQS